MEEREVIKSERFNVKLVSLIIVIIGIVLFIAYVLYDLFGYYGPRFNELAAKNYDWFDYKSPLDMAIKQDGNLIIAIFVPVVFIIIAFLVYHTYSKVELTVTDKRVYGRAKFGKRVDLPLDSISAVGTSAMKGIDVTTASGAIKFKFIKNREAIHSAISKLLVNRQGKEKSVATTTIKQEIPQSNADELKKYKDLLDSGVITQEEFDAKKKQLLGL